MYLDIHNFLLMPIYAWVVDTVTKIKWLFLSFYGVPASSKRSHTWNLLDAMKPANITAWMIVGNFIEIPF